MLVSGPSGTGKSTAVRGLAALLPEIEVVGDCPFSWPQRPCSLCMERRGRGEELPAVSRRVRVVTLPLNATKDRVAGSVAIARALREGITALQPGLLAEANRGILYVDEINLLDDHLCDVLLDAAAMGVSVVEREGVSISPRRFLLVGTMNPEEGELRPQIADRIGLHVAVEGLTDTGVRAQVLRRREAFGRDPVAFAQTWADKERAVGGRVDDARRSIGSVVVLDTLYEAIAQLVVRSGVVSHRADVTILECAKALAVLAGRTEVIAADVLDAARLALGHHAPTDPFDANAGIDDRLCGGFSTTCSRWTWMKRTEKKRRARRGRRRHRRRRLGHDPGDRGRRRRHGEGVLAGRADGQARGGRSVTGGGLWSPCDGGSTHVTGWHAVAMWTSRWTRRCGRRPRAPAARGSGSSSRPRTCGARCASTASPSRCASSSTTATRSTQSGWSSGERARLPAPRGRDDPRRPRLAGLVPAWRGRGDRRAAPTSSRMLASRRLRRSSLSGRTPLAHALREAARLVRQERAKRPNARPVVVIVSDGLPDVPLSSRRRPGCRRACPGTRPAAGRRVGRGDRRRATGARGPLQLWSSARRRRGWRVSPAAEVSPDVFAAVLNGAA